jgi:hypothetical protein
MGLLGRASGTTWFSNHGHSLNFKGMRTGNRKPGTFVLVSALLLGGLWWLKESRDAGERVADQTPSMSLEGYQAGAVVTDSIQVLSDTLTPTGRVYVASKDGVTKTATVPESWQLTLEQLEAMLFADQERVVAASGSEVSRL